LAKKAVILDRYYFSSIAYQGALGLDPSQIREENESFCPVPDKVFVFLVPPSTGINRIKTGRKQNPDLFEKEQYLQKVSEIFNSLHDEFVVKVDGTQDPDSIQKSIMTIVSGLVDHYIVTARKE